MAAQLTNSSDLGSNSSDGSVVEKGATAHVQGVAADDNDDHGDHTHRKLKARHIHLIGIGGTIGTTLYVQIGKGLISGGPASLFIAFALWCTFVLAVTLSVAEMVTYLPLSSPFIRFAGRYVDEALGFAAGWNFFLYEAALVPLEIVGCVFILQFWGNVIPQPAIIMTVLILYGLINVLAVKWYGETEFWAAVGKVILIVLLMLFTLVVMLGGNPLHDRFGFRYWSDPGPFAELYYNGALGQFLGFLQCLILASFTIAGPDYVSMAAGEAENPRAVMPRAYNAVFSRLTVFFVLGSLCVGILVPYTDKELAMAFLEGKPGAAASPYVVAMNRLQIGVLPHLVNGIVFTAAFSAGNSYVYCASRSLYGLALEGKAPRLLTKCTKSGVPIIAVLATLTLALLAFLQLGSSSATVLQWFINLVTASQLINLSIMCLTYLRFYGAMKAQGISRDTLPYKAPLQPYAAWYGLIGTFVMTYAGGYVVFLPGKWETSSFLFSYTMVAAVPLLYISFKLWKKTKILPLAKVDVINGLANINRYEENYVTEPSTSTYERILNYLFA